MMARQYSAKSSRKSRGLAFTICTALFVGSCSTNPERAKAKYFAEGQKYLKKGAYGDASVEFRNALRLDPRFVDAYYQLAQAYLAQRDWRSAYASLEKAIELDPGRLDARLDRGRLYLAARQFDKAEDEARWILAKDSNSVAGYQLLGASLMGQQKADGALEAFTRVPDLLPTDASAYINLALVEISLRRFSDAEQHLKKAVAIDPKSLQANTDLANFYRLQNKLLRAQEVLQAGISINPDAPELYINWADLLSSSGNASDAFAVLDKLRNRLTKSPEAAIAIGDFYAQKNDANKSLAEYQRGLSVAPGNLEIQKRLEELYLISNRTDEASKLDAQLMKQAPKDLFVGITHGRILLAQGKRQDGIVALQKASKNAPDSAQAHYYLGTGYWQSESLGQASSEFQEAIKVSPGFPLALRGLAQLNLAQKHFVQAQVYAQELVQRFPAEVSYRLLLGETLLREGQPRRAEEQFLIAIQLTPNLAAVHLDLGQVYAAQEKWSLAEKEFENAIQLDPSNLSTLSPYANFLVARQQAPKAIALLQQFISANPTNAHAHVILGALQFGIKDAIAAQAEFERAIQIDPKDVQAFMQLGALHTEKKETDAAIGQYEKALELQPKSAPLDTMVGTLYIEKGDLETARKYLVRALEADPNFPIANANLAWIDAQEGRDLDVALGMAQKSKSQLPDVPSISDTLAWVMYKKGNYSGAIPLLRECLKKAPDSAQCHYHLGLTLIAAGQKQVGRTEIGAALQTNKLTAADQQQAKRVLASEN